MMFLTCSCFSSKHSIKVWCINLPGQNRLSVARGHFLHVTVHVWSHMGPSSLTSAEVIWLFRLHQRRPITLLILDHVPACVWGTVHRSSLVEKSIIWADCVELLPGVCDRAGPRQVELGARSPPYSGSVPGGGADQTTFLLPISGPLHPWRFCWPW